MDKQILKDTVAHLFADNKGLLAMDESNGTCNKRFAKIGISQTEVVRRDWRELLVTTPSRQGLYNSGMEIPAFLMTQ